MVRATLSAITSLSESSAELSREGMAKARANEARLHAPVRRCQTRFSCWRMMAWCSTPSATEICICHRTPTGRYVQELLLPREIVAQCLR